MPRSAKKVAGRRACIVVGGIIWGAFTPTESAGRDIGAVQEDHTGTLKELAVKAVEEDGADVIILTGAPLAGLARSVKADLPVPVVDGVSSAVRHCESLVALAPGFTRTGSFARPPAKPNQGVPPALAALLAGK